jgi:hypothetical protein
MEWKVCKKFSELSLRNAGYSAHLRCLVSLSSYWNQPRAEHGADFFFGLIQSFCRLPVRAFGVFSLR